MPNPDILDSRIRSMVAELIESAPQAPALPELDWGESRRQAHQRRRLPDWLGQRPRQLALVGVAAVVGVVLLVVATFPIAGGRSGSEAAAAQLHQIAVKAASQLPPQLGSNEWLLTEQHVSFSAQVSQVGSTPTHDAQATVSATIRERG